MIKTSSKELQMVFSKRWQFLIITLLMLQNQLTNSYKTLETYLTTGIKVWKAIIEFFSSVSLVHIIIKCQIRMLKFVLLAEVYRLLIATVKAVSASMLHSNWDSIFHTNIHNQKRGFDVMAVCYIFASIKVPMYWKKVVIKGIN